MSSIMTPSPIGADFPPLDPATEEKIVKKVDELSDLYFDQLHSVWDGSVRNYRLYLSDVDDPRSEEEKLWRAHIFPPRPQIITDSKVAVEYDIITSVDPPIQAEGIGSEDAGGAFGERLLAYAMRGMKFRKGLPPWLRAISIQGTEFSKLYHGCRKHVFYYSTTPTDLDRFQKSLMDAEAAHPELPAPDPLNDPKSFEIWRQLINKGSGGKIKVGLPPIAGPREVRLYEGPMLDRVSIFDLWLDPAEEEMAKQPAVFHRLVKSRRWVRAMAQEGDQYPFDAMRVELALNDKTNKKWKHYGDRFTSHRDEIYQIQGISPSKVTDPIWDDAVEVFECFFGTDGIPGEYPYLVICNGVVINKYPGQMPYMHGQIPIFAARNLVLGGHFHGISDYRPLESIFLENASFRNLRMDGAKLSMLPVIAKLASVGVPGLFKQLKPGMVVNVPRLDAFTQLFKMSMPEGAWREPADLKEDMDESTAAYGHIRGASATVGRVSATENQSRFNSAISRLKLAAAQIEEDMDDFPFQCLALMYQFLPEDQRLKIGGPGDPYVDVSKDEILEAMEQDYKFLGATKAINRELVAQKLMEFGKVYAENLTPAELRVLMEDVISSIGVRNAQSIVSADGTKDAVEAYAIKKEMAKMQAEMAKQQLIQQQLMAQAPGQVSGATAQALGAESGAPEQAPAAPVQSSTPGNGAPPA